MRRRKLWWLALRCSLLANALRATPDLTSPLAVETCVGRSTVVIQGVLHGSSSSAEDVRIALQARRPDVIMLELCTPRWRSLSLRNNSTVVEDLQRVWMTTRRANKERGVPAALAAAAVGTLYAVSRLVGFEPGIEFTIPLEFAERNAVDVVLGDRDVIETLSLSADADLVNGYKALGRAALGTENHQDLRLVSSLLRNPHRLAEFSKLVLAVSTIASVVAATFDLALDSIPRVQLVDVAFASSFVYLLGTIGAQIVDARDDFLFNSLHSAVSLAETRQDPDRERCSTVLVVVGALHVNGLLHRLRSIDETSRL